MNEKRIQHLQTCFNLLSLAQTVDELCHMAVDCVVNRLGFDRCGISLYDAENRCKQGTWGTNERGQLVSEHHETFPLREDEIKTPRDCDAGIRVIHHRELLMEDKPVGKGWLVQCGIFDNEQILGWIFIDNLISQGALQTEEVSLIRLFGTYVGQMIVRQRHTESYKLLNRELESSYKKLAEKERLASIGQMVAGVSHELNTPLGVALTSESHVQELLATLDSSFQSGKLTRSLMSATLTEIESSMQLSFHNLNRIRNLANRFKQLAVHKEEIAPKQVNFSRLLNDLTHNFEVMNPAAQLSIECRVDDSVADVSLRLPPFQEVIHILLENTLQHAYSKSETKPVLFEAHLSHPHRLNLIYSDQGQGVDDELLERFFSPFFTTNRQKGPGLGTSILYNLVTYRLEGTITAGRSQQGGLQLIISLPI